MAYDKMVDSAALETDLASVANAIRAKAGTSDSLVFPDGFVSAVEGIQAGGGGSGGGVLDSIIARSETSYTLSGVTKVGDYALSNFTNLEAINLPDCEELGNNCFRDCKSLLEFYAPKVKKAGEQVFYTNTGGYALIESLYFPELLTCSANAFKGMKYLETFRAPKLTSVGNYALQSNPALVFADIGFVSSLGWSLFSNDSVFTTLVLRANKVATLSQVNVFTNTPFASGGTGGTVYVPSALIESYKTASNWSALYEGGSCNFVALEGSEYE